MKTLFPKVEIYKANDDVVAADMTTELINDLGATFKKHGFYVRIGVQTGQEIEQRTLGVVQEFVKKLFRL